MHICLEIKNYIIRGYDPPLELAPEWRKIPWAYHNHIMLNLK